MADIVRSVGMEPVCTKDGSLITAENLKQYAAVMFYTSGDLCEVAAQTADGKADLGPVVTPQGKAELLDLIRSGQLAFVGIHSAADTWHTVDPARPGKETRYVAQGEKLDPYLAMLGAEFIAHDKHQPGTIIITDDKFPGMTYPGPRVRQEKGEWYSLKDFAPDMHVIMVMDTEGLDGPHYQRGPYPLTWARKYGSGNVFYTALGHGRESWDDQNFLNLLAGGLRWATGQAEADLTPNLAQVAPRHAEIPAPPARPKKQPEAAQAASQSPQKN
jgi:type 1 glutamine amidotransferase